MQTNGNKAGCAFGEIVARRIGHSTLYPAHIHGLQMRDGFFVK
jgi:hypothetical protein